MHVFPGKLPDDQCIGMLNQHGVMVFVTRHPTTNFKWFFQIGCRFRKQFEVGVGDAYVNLISKNQTRVFSALPNGYRSSGKTLPAFGVTGNLCNWPGLILRY